MVERTDDHPGTGSATYCSAVSLRQASKTLVLAQRSYANNATTSSCMVISPVNCSGLILIMASFGMGGEPVPRVYGLVRREASAQRGIFRQECTLPTTM